MYVAGKEILAVVSGGNLTKDFYNTHFHENKDDYGTTKSTKTKAFQKDAKDWEIAVLCHMGLPS
jgi:hypothetical protein